MGDEAVRKCSVNGKTSVKNKSERKQQGQEVKCTLE